MVTKISEKTTPSQLLSLAIRKRRRVMSPKNRNIRIELLLGQTIKNLCKVIGEERAAERKKRYQLCESEINSCKAIITKVQRLHSSANVSQSGCRQTQGQSTTGVSAVVPGTDSVVDHSVSQTCSAKPMDMSDDFSSCFSKRSHVASADTNSNYKKNDPFDLDKSFASLRTCRSSGTA